MRRTDSPREVAIAMTIPELIAERAAAGPSLTAVRWANGVLTYGQLDRLARRIGGRLRALGVARDDVVGVHLGRSPELIGALLGAWAAGGAYMPLDPAYPTERLRFMIEQSGAKVVLTDAAGAARLAGCSAELIRIDRLPDGQESGPGGRSAPEDLAYVIYTSGSTGQPKGVEIHHGALRNLCTWFSEQFALAPGDRVTFVSGLGFDAAVSELWPALAAGACLCLPDDEVRLTPSRFRDWLVAERVNIAFAPTPMTEALIGLDWPADTALRWVYAGGDQLKRRPPAGLPFRLGNAYGPTECACIATFAEVAAVGDGLPDIGRPITGLSVELLADDGRPAAEGELCIGGAGVGRGYRGRPDLTAERFVLTDFGRLYRTGDLARRRPDGALEFLGRLDGQVKLRGFRIELDEIAAVLLQHPSVTAATVTVHADGRGEKRLVAYTVPAVDPVDLRSVLAAKLPAYMIPSAFVGLEALPLTPNGKVDRPQLPAPVFSRVQTEYVAPAGPLEERLSRLCADVLGLEAVGMQDDFFALGGHSLLATQLLSRVGAPVSIADFLSAPTMAALARLATAAGASPADAPIAAAPRPDGPLALSFAQQRLWFFDRLEPGSPLYNIAEAIRLTGPLDVARLEQAINLVITRHESLRTNFTTDGQVIHPERRLSLTVETEPVDLAAEARRPFDLGRDPLLRVRLIRLAPDEHLLLLTIHHIISDGWSMGVFYGEVSQAYAGEPLPPVPLQYCDFAAWQRRWLADGAGVAQLAWWRAQLDGVDPVLELPVDRPRPPAQSFAGARRVRLLPAPLLEALGALAHSEGATLFMTLLAAYQTLLYRYTGQERFAVGAPIAGRNRQELETCIGFFVNTLPIPSDFRGAPTFRQVLRRTRERCLGAFAHQDLPFDQLVEALAPVREPSRPPLVQTLFALQNAPTGELHLPGMIVSNPEPTGVDTGTAKYDLIVTVEEAAGATRAVAEFATALYDPETAERLLGHFETLLAAVAADADQPVGALPILTEREQQQLLVDWNSITVNFSRQDCAPTLVAAQDPDATAVVMGDRHLTYGELNRRANGLAWRLRALGVEPGVPVGVCLERSPDLVVALLAVWRAGGAYVAMDAALPPERLSFMARDSGAAVVITQHETAAPFVSIPPLCLEDLADAEDAVPPPTDLTETNLAYVIYTSGSTGQPKGVAIEHGGLLNLIYWHRQTYGVTPATRATQLAGMGFDASVWELWPYLTAGAAIHMPDEATRLSPPALRDWLIANRIEITFLPTPLAEAVLALDWPEHHDLRYLLTGGDKLHGYPDRERGFTLVNHYGPTESTVVATAGAVPVRPGASAAPPIGRPIAGIRAYVVDGERQPVPVGVPGELYVGGAGLARGYLNRPELTAERFVTTPYGRAYRTGDLVRWLPDGQLEFLGRTDFQVKVRGLRIELGEIESALLGHPDVADAVAVVYGDQLVAYVVPKPAKQPHSLKAHLARTLPAYMIPTAIISLERFPLTPNGKVDRRALPVPAAEPAAYEPPVGETEARLAAIWADVLGRDRISRNDDFFALGGQSLLATRLVARVREQLGADLPLKALFETPVLSELAARITAGKRLSRDEAPGLDLADPETARRWLDRLHELPDELVAELLARFGAKEETDT